MGTPTHERAIDALTDEDDHETAKDYTFLEKIGEGTYGMVYKAFCHETGDRVAIKKIKILPEDDGVPSTALREISLLKCFNHLNVIRLHDVYCSSKNLNLVFECLDMDLRIFLKRNGPIRDGLLRSAICQCLQGVEFCHSRRILHRDLKPQNVLVDVNTKRFVLADFGLARLFSIPSKIYTHEVVTLWYRAPEILLGQTKYGPSMDVWSLGCIVAEMATVQPLFPGDSEIDTIFKIFRLLGTPNEHVWPGISQLPEFKQNFPQWNDTNFADVRRLTGQDFGDEGIDLLKRCLRYDLVDRPSARALLHHKFFDNINVGLRAS